jgi:hypothetical protein
LRLKVLNLSPDLIIENGIPTLSDIQRRWNIF